MIYEEQKIKDLYLIKPKEFKDPRGSTLETYRQQEINKVINRDVNFVQYNLSKSIGNVIRGLHYQSEIAAQGKLVQVIEGEIFDVAVDIRKNSETFGQWVGVILNEQNNNLFWIPEGFAHGFYVVSKSAKVFYHLTNYYNPQEEHCIKWDDEDLKINWPSKENPIVSEKDKKGKKFEDSEYFNN